MSDDDGMKLAFTFCVVFPVYQLDSRPTFIWAESESLTKMPSQVVSAACGLFLPGSAACEPLLKECRPELLQEVGTTAALTVLYLGVLWALFVYSKIGTTVLLILSLIVHILTHSIPKTDKHITLLDSVFYLSTTSITTTHPNHRSTSNLTTPPCYNLSYRPRSLHQRTQQARETPISLPSIAVKDLMAHACPDQSESDTERRH